MSKFHEGQIHKLSVGDAEILKRSPIGALQWQSSWWVSEGQPPPQKKSWIHLLPKSQVRQILHVNVLNKIMWKVNRFTISLVRDANGDASPHPPHPWIRQWILFIKSFHLVSVCQFQVQIRLDVHKLFRGIDVVIDARCALSDTAVLSVCRAHCVTPWMRSRIVGKVLK